MAENKFDLTVIGSGPGGYVAAIRAAQLGIKAAVLESDNVGGVCLNWGCIPTKALLKSAEVLHTLKRHKEFGIQVENIAPNFEQIIKRSRRVARRLSKGVEFLFKKNEIAVFKGNARLSAANKIAVYNENNEQIEEVSSDKIIIATGARPRSIPNINFDGEKIITSKEALTLENLPESMVVIGAGAIGVEFAYFYNTLGCKIDIVEMMPTILPIEDQEITDIVTKSFKKSKIAVHTNSMVKQIDLTNNGVKVTISSDDTESIIEADKALVAIGVQGNSEGIGLDELGIEIENSWINVDENFQTNVENIYAIGDIIGPPWLAHVASAEGIFTVEKMAGLTPKSLDYGSIPGCTYCQPQVGSIGLTEQKAIEQGFELKTGRFPFQANGKSIALGESTGLVKLIFNAKTNNLLGAHIVHAEATELINELSVVKTNGISGHDLIKTVHAHPTLSETIMEAAAAAYDEAVHL